MEQYLQYLKEQEKSKSTLEKYRRELNGLLQYFGERNLEKTALLQWKAQLEQMYRPSSVNGALVAVNGFFSYMGWFDLRMKLLKMQKNIFLQEEKELTKTEYRRLVQAAGQKGNRRLSLVMETICATGIRVSELQYITLAAVEQGRAEVQGKGKRRIILLPARLRQKLKQYAKSKKIQSGAIFRTKSGRPLHRSNIWSDMKKLCLEAGVPDKKVFPHNLRHLFARTFYQLDKDIAKLADLLGHASIETTRIYIMESGKEHQKKLERMGLIW